MNLYCNINHDPRLDVDCGLVGKEGRTFLKGKGSSQLPHPYWSPPPASAQYLKERNAVRPRHHCCMCHWTFSYQLTYMTGHFHHQTHRTA